MVLEDVHDRPLLDLRISVTDRCNMRCRYCMPREHFDENHEFLPKEDILRFEEIVRVVEALIPHGLRKVRLTGGEPLLRRDLHELIRQLRASSADLDIAITTNGLLLKRQLTKLHEAGLSRVTISLDSLKKEVYQRMGDTDAEPSIVLEAIDEVQARGIPLKINTVVKKNVNDDQIIDMIETFGPRQIPVRFIEYMDVGTTNNWNLIMLFQVKSCVQELKRSSEHCNPIKQSTKAMSQRCIPPQMVGKSDSLNPLPILSVVIVLVQGSPPTETSTHVCSQTTAMMFGEFFGWVEHPMTSKRPFSPFGRGEKTVTLRSGLPCRQKVR